jgi:hypothetical protein
VSAVRRMLASVEFPTCGSLGLDPGLIEAMVPAALDDYCLSMDPLDWSEADVRGAYDADANLRLALIHLIQIIGEAGRQVSREFSDRYPEIPWADIIGMRHKVVHDYSGLMKTSISMDLSASARSFFSSSGFTRTYCPLATS